MQEENMMLKDKVIVVTGATSGIGEAVARDLLEAGAIVYALGRNKDSLAELGAHPNCTAVELDIASEDEIVAFAGSIDKVDGLVNSAGISVLESVFDITTENLRKILDVNLIGLIVMSREIAKIMVENKTAGAIVNVSSNASTIGVPDHLAYCSSKGAVDAATRVLAVELGKYNIRVNNVNPTVTLTAMGRMAWSDPAKSNPVLARMPLGRFAEPSEVSKPILFLLSDDASMISGANLQVDGGFNIR